jgi:hypothetical protein
MATVNVESTNYFANQANYIGEDLNLYLLGSGTSTITITNPSHVGDVLNLKISDTASNRDKIINVGNGANVKLSTLSFSYMFNPTGPSLRLQFNVRDGASLELTSNVVSSFGSHPVTIHLGDGTATLIYPPTGNSAGANVPNLSGISAGDQIQVVGAKAAEYTNGKLIFRDQTGKQIASFNAPGLDASLVQFRNGKMSYACYLRGTHIATPEGEKKVEDLNIGDRVLTLKGGVSKVKWIGYRTLRKARIPPEDAAVAFPIRFVKDAIATGIPHRDLVVSPWHHIFFDSKLIPAMKLVNGKTITQEFSRTVFEYFHIELETFDILLAEGVLAESYVDTGNRSMFQNAHTVALNPNFGPAKGRQKIPDIEVVRSGLIVETVHQQLLDRAVAMMQANNVERQQPGSDVAFAHA